MPRRRTAAPVSRLRGLLLVLIVVLLAGLGGLYWFGRAGRSGPLPRSLPSGERVPEGEITLVGEGFEFTHTEGARPVFRIRGESVRADRAGTVYLDDVGLTLYDAEGVGYEVSAKQASFNQDTREARLAGDVVLRGPRQTTLATRGVRLRQRGDVLESAGPVRFTYGELQGRADKLRAVRDQELYTLSGNVVVESLPEAQQRAQLTCRQLVFDRTRHQVRALGDATLVRGADRVRAGQVNAFLDDDDRQVVFLRGRFEVAGQLAEVDGRPVSFTSRSVSILRDTEGRPRSAEMEGTAAEPLEIVTTAADGHRQKLVAGFAVAAFEEGRPTSVESYNAPRLLETAARGGKALREISARRLEAAFDAGGAVSSVRADDDFRYRDEELRARGGRGSFDVAADRGELAGDPAVLESERGELQAPHLEIDRGDGVVHATGGVRAAMRQAADVGLAGTPLAGGQGPLRVEAQEAWWRDDPRSALFRGDVRAWRDENLLLAASVRADRAAAGERLEATGGVRTVWVPDKQPGEPAGTGVPVEVTSRTLTYDRGADELIYEGSVHAEQQDRVLVCPRLEVALTDDGQAKRMTCIGPTQLDDRQAGNTARATGAVYDLDARTVTMRGDPVTLKKSDGAQIEGARVIYDLATGGARVVRDRPATTTPEEQPGAADAGGGAG